MQAALMRLRWQHLADPTAHTPMLTTGWFPRPMPALSRHKACAEPLKMRKQPVLSCMPACTAAY
jgi:hypothetical protein